MIKQCKGKEIQKVPQSELKDGLWYGSTKYDGHYVQIQKRGDTVKFFTSGGKEFHLEKLSKDIVLRHKGFDYTVEAEYLYDCLGKKGDRVHSAKLTTYRTQFAKGITVLGSQKDIFIVFDIIELSFQGAEVFGHDAAFAERIVSMETLFVSNPVLCIHPVEYRTDTLESFKKLVLETVKKGWEGLFIKHADHVYKPGKRVNDAIKLKIRPTTELLCIGVEPGKGKYEGMIGSLVLEDEDRNLQVSVGSGLTDADRALDPAIYIGEDIEIEYEQILGTYIQPTFVGIKP